MAWQMERSWEDVLSQAGEHVAKVVSALGSGVRLRIVGELVTGPMTTGRPRRAPRPADLRPALPPPQGAAGGGDRPPASAGHVRLAPAARAAGARRALRRQRPGARPATPTRGDRAVVIVPASGRLHQQLVDARASPRCPGPRCRHRRPSRGCRARRGGHPPTTGFGAGRRRRPVAHRLVRQGDDRRALRPARRTGTGPVGCADTELVPRPRAASTADGRRRPSTTSSAAGPACAPT